MRIKTKTRGKMCRERNYIYFLVYGKDFLWSASFSRIFELLSFGAQGRDCLVSLESIRSLNPGVVIVFVFLSSGIMLEGKACLISRALPSSCEQESKWIYMTYELLERSNNKRPMSDELTDNGGENLKRKKSLENPLLPNNEELDPSTHENDGNGSVGEYSDSNSLISSIGRDNSINCLLHCSRSDYGSLASLNRSFRSLIRSGELYRLRRQMGITEHWVYFSCHVLEWEAYDPYASRWLTLPKLPHNECFMCSDKESLAVGTELLVFGKEVTAHIVLRYSILTNSWTDGEAYELS
ncbi:hypothetical protein J5N97_017226 [Dioscorea zingiberensis]|uniref:F-box/kelch-repeat protein n=1 Tax=Dioscorea zingiberensis TaxID=325984 RepID=A0A9D5CKS3_9LILI|nr:hypothetical protein J5N97_017226 [Dioscorea zingiberensis]